MPTSLIIVDDFLDNPHALRDAALRLTYPPGENMFPGRNSVERINLEGLSVYNFFVKCDFTSTLPEEEREAMAEDLSEVDEDWVPPPFLHPYFDISKAPHHIRSWNVMPKREDLNEWGLLVRHAMKGIIEEDEAA